MERYHPLKTNTTATSVLLTETSEHASQLLDNALLRIDVGTGLRELLASTSALYTSED